jgi:large subunit ribosomal protein L21
MLAIVDLNGKQYQVEEGRYLEMDKLPHGEGDTFSLETVQLIVDGEKSLVGAPYVAGAKVQLKVLSHYRGPKLIVYKMRRKKGYRRKNGHRQPYCRVQVESIQYAGK